MPNQTLLAPSRALDANGLPVAGALAYVYASGTMTLISVFSNSAATIAQANPVVANGNGVFPQVFVNQTAKVVVKTAAGVTLYTIDPAFLAVQDGAAASVISFSPSATLPFTTVQAAIDGLNADTARRSNNLSDLTNKPLALTNLGLLIAAAQINAAIDQEMFFINGGFDVWQRGGSFTSPGTGALQYTADRWYQSSVGGAVVATRQAMSVGSQLGNNTPEFVFRQSVSGQTGTNYAYFGQRIEGVRSCAGQAVTVVFYARNAGVFGNKLGVNFEQRFGTGGTPAATVSSDLQIINLTGAMQAYAVTFAVPQINGKQLGTGANDCLAINFWTSHGGVAALGLQTIDVEISGVHIRQGAHTAAVISNYEAPRLVDELPRCLRYFQTGEATSPVAIAAGGYFQVPFGLRMRATPTITRTGDGAVYTLTAGSTPALASPAGFYWTRATANFAGGAYTADAEL